MSAGERILKESELNSLLLVLGIKKGIGPPVIVFTPFNRCSCKGEQIWLLRCLPFHRLFLGCIRSVHTTCTFIVLCHSQFCPFSEVASACFWPSFTLSEALLTPRDLFYHISVCGSQGMTAAVRCLNVYTYLRQSSSYAKLSCVLLSPLYKKKKILLVDVPSTQWNFEAWVEVTHEPWYVQRVHVWK